MPTITLEIPEELEAPLNNAGDHLPELLRRALNTSALPAQVYRYVLNFLASRPTPEEIASFQPLSEMTARLRELVQKERAGIISPSEKEELDEYDKIEHVVRMMKIGALPYLTAKS
jgi:hypothetical protein